MLSKLIISLIALIVPLFFGNGVNVAYAESSEPVTSEVAPFEEKVLCWESAKNKQTLTLKSANAAILKIDYIDENGEISESLQYSGTYILSQEEQTIVFTLTKENGEKWEFTYKIIDYNAGLIEYIKDNAVEESIKYRVLTYEDDSIVITFVLKENNVCEGTIKEIGKEPITDNLYYEIISETEVKISQYSFSFEYAILTIDENDRVIDVKLFETTPFEEKTYCWQKGLKVAVLKLESETEYNLSYFTEKAELSTFKGKYEQDGNKLTLYNGEEVLCVVYYNDNGNFYFDGEEEIHLQNETFQAIWDSLNAPLPIAGISILVILAWVSMVIFILRKGSSFGRKNINKLNANDKEMKEHIEQKDKELEQKYKEKEALLDAKIKEYDEAVASYKHDVDVIIENSRNKNVLALRGDKPNGEETEEKTER